MTLTLFNFRWLALLLILFSSATMAVNKNFQAFANEAQELRYQALIEELRCVVCQNQSLADSNAELAQDLRDEVRRMIIGGQTDDEITDFLVQRYGDFVLYRPPVKPKTYVLWAGPFALVIFGIIIMLFFIRRHSKEKAKTAELTDAEKQKIQQALKDSNT